LAIVLGIIGALIFIFIISLGIYYYKKYKNKYKEVEKEVAALKKLKYEILDEKNKSDNLLKTPSSG
jgi:hypothetical protein